MIIRIIVTFNCPRLTFQIIPPGKKVNLAALKFCGTTKFRVNSLIKQLNMSTVHLDVTRLSNAIVLTLL